MFGLVTENSAFTENFDAIVGMAYPEFAEPGVTPFFDGLIDSGVLDQKVFSFHMSLNPEKEDSMMILGGWDESKFSGDLAWYEVVNRRFFAIQLDDVLIDGVSTGYCTPEKNCLITPDTGTSLITFPTEAYNLFMEDHGDVVECEANVEYTYGDLTFVIGGKNYGVPSHHWMERETTTVASNSKGGNCQTTISNLDVYYDGLEELFIAGDSFM